MSPSSIGSIIRRFRSNAHALAVLAQGVSAVLGFGTFLLLIRVLAQDVFGGWVLYLAGATLLDMLRAGMVQAALVHFATDPDSTARERVAGAGWVLGIAVTVVLIAGVKVAAWIMPETAVVLFATWWPWLTAVSLPFQMAFWKQQAEGRFDQMLALRLVIGGSFLVVPAAGAFGVPIVLETILAAQIASAALGSLTALALGWASFRSLRRTDRAMVLKLFHFGKYSLGTLLGANLLRSADTFLIGAVLGPASVAIYTMSQRLVEAIEVPLKGLAAAAYPEMAGLTHRGDLAGLGSFFNRSVGALTLVLAPVLVVAWVAADDVVIMLGGSAYASAGTLLRIFLIYAMLLPLDRYIGMALDGLGKPHLNTVKVGFMVTVNVAGDLVALHTFGSVVGVALVTVGMTLVGLVVGIFFLRRSVDVRLSNLVSEGWAQCRSVLVFVVQTVREVLRGVRYFPYGS